MKQQVVVIHGGRTFPIYDDYISSLKNREVDKGIFLRPNDWKDCLKEKLGGEFEVFFPKMPNGNNAVYDEWKIWFERMSEFLADNVILIGHSLGGIFLVKYFSENRWNKKIKAVILVAAPCDDEAMHESLGKFTLPANFELFSSQVANLHLMFSKDDPVVPYIHAQKYGKIFSGAQLHVFEDRNHFQQKDFPEIIELIKELR